MDFFPEGDRQNMVNVLATACDVPNDMKNEKIDVGYRNAKREDF